MNDGPVEETTTGEGAMSTASNDERGPRFQAMRQLSASQAANFVREAPAFERQEAAIRQDHLPYDPRDPVERCLLSKSKPPAAP
jgi:hypothetical protein